MFSTPTHSALAESVLDSMGRKPYNENSSGFRDYGVARSAKSNQRRSFASFLTLLDNRYLGLLLVASDDCSNERLIPFGTLPTCLSFWWRHTAVNGVFLRLVAVQKMIAFYEHCGHNNRQRQRAKATTVSRRSVPEFSTRLPESN